MVTLTFTDPQFSYEIVTVTTPLTLATVGVSSILTHFGELELLSPIKELKCEHISGVHYTYLIEFVDGREWHQDFYFEGTTFNTCEVTFSVTSPFSFPTLERMIAMRRGIDYLVRNLGVTKIEINRLP